MANKPKIAVAVPTRMALWALAAILIIGAAWSYQDYRSLLREIEVFRENHINEQKAFLKSVVSDVAGYVRVERDLFKEIAAQEYMAMTNEALSLASNLSTKLGADGERNVVETAVREALRPLRLNASGSHFFAIDQKGVLQLVSGDERLEGESALNSPDTDTRNVAVKLVEMGRTSQGGTVEFHWVNPQSQTPEPWMVYVKPFAPLDWIIGVGDRISDIESRTQARLIERISTTTAGGGNYLFAGQWDGVSLAGPAKGRNMIDVEDVNGVKIVQELIKTAQNGGGFVEYYLPGFDGGTPRPKLSYVEGVKGLDWYIGAGVMVDEIEREVRSRTSMVNKRIASNVSRSMLILLALIAVYFAVTRRISAKLDGDFAAFQSFFDRAAKESVTIDAEAMNYMELQTIASSANKMVRAQKETESLALDRSAELEIKNQQLEHEIEERQKAQQRLSDHQQQLEAQIEERTRDIAKAKERADDASKAKSDFLANMSHELRTPLNAIIGFSDTILHQVLGPIGNDKYQEYIANIHSSGAHLLDLINDILDLSAIEAGKMELHEELVDLEEIADAAVLQLQSRADIGGVKLGMQMIGYPDYLYADKRRILQIMLNLLSNAVKFTPRDGTVTVFVERLDEQLIFRVRDSGSGMDEAGIARAMEPFGHTNTHIAGVHEGTGLGLPLTHELVKAHDGEMQIDSQLGVGTTITVRFPQSRIRERKGVLDGAG